jgi:hypothetical protein
MTQVPALNTDAGFISDLSNMVIEALAAPALSVQEAFMENNCDRNSDKKSNTSNTTSRRSLRVKAGNSARPASPRSGSTSSSGSSGSGRAVERESSLTRAFSTGLKAAEHMATLGCLAFMIDGCGREIVLNSQLPIINNLTF